MAETFERFTDQARRALRLAEEEASHHRHGYIGTEHLLLGLMAAEEGTAAAPFAELGLGVEEARHQLGIIIGEEEERGSGGVGLTPQAEQAIRASLAEADRLGHRDVGTEHLVLGLLTDEHALAVRIVETLGVSPQHVRQAVERRL
jgi:ATP-dependent Clp protease ATP-binding subunit ClpC